MEPATCWGFAPFFPRTLKIIKIFATFSELVPHAARAFCAKTIWEKINVRNVIFISEPQLKDGENIVI